MATKIDCFFLNDNTESVTVHNCQTVHDNQYSNLNLNQNFKCLDVSPIQSNSKSYNNKNCGTAATLKLPESPVSDNIEGRENPLHLNKPSKISDFSNFINDKTENEESKKPWKKNSSPNITNGSTLSLHIAAYENSAKADSFIGSKNKDLQKGKSYSIKNEKQSFNAGTFVIQNSFEFPRQENEEAKEPEVSNFRASQRLFNPNEASENGTEADLFDLLGGDGGGRSAGFFGGLFGGHGGGHQSRRRKGQSTMQPLNVTLEDLYKGKTTKLQLTKKVVCKTCNGAGGKNGAQCYKCGGKGKVMATRMVGPGMIQQSVQACPHCHGKGSTIADKDKCNTCSGNQTITEQKVIEVNISPGMREGQKIVLHNEGDQEPGIEAGDVILVIQCKEHKLFERKGDDLFITKKISLAEALCGFKMVVEHLDGHKIVMQTEPGVVLEPECIRAVMGEGMPIPNQMEHGNLYCISDIKFPSNHFFAEDKLYKHLEAALPAKPKTVPLGEEVSLHEFDERRYERSSRREAYHGDEDDEEMYEGHGGPQVQCAQQ